MSPLTEADILRTGTIALCKYNRLMVTSPRDLLKGYRWLDTAVHEFTHLLINRVADGVPIWLHEGLARYSETLWRQNNPDKLSPYSESLLANAVKKDKLIPFAKMHPSMAKLPSQEMAAQAYAQVYTVILYLVERKGRTSISKVLQRIFKGTKVTESVAKVVGEPFPTFLESWKGYLKKKKLKYIANLMPKKKVIKGHAPEKSKEQKEKERNLWYKPSKAKELGERHLKLGELLRRQRRLRAALFEYRKAEHYWKDRNPRLQNKLAKTLLDLRRYKAVIDTLKKSLTLYRSNVTTYIHMGRAYYYLRQPKKAREALEEANQINPFHPLVHRYLARVYAQLGDTKRQKREQRVSALLQKAN